MAFAPGLQSSDPFGFVSPKAADVEDRVSDWRILPAMAHPTCLLSRHADPHAF
jgi:hypothetical protein